MKLLSSVLVVLGLALVTACGTAEVASMTKAVASDAQDTLAGVYSVLPGPGGRGQPVVTLSDGSTVNVRWQSREIGQALQQNLRREVVLDGYYTDVQESALPGLPPRPVHVFMVTAVHGPA